MRIRKKYVQEIVDVLHEIILHFDCECMPEESKQCDYCRQTAQKVHTICGNLEQVGIIDDKNRVLDPPKDEWKSIKRLFRKHNKKSNRKRAKR